MIFVDRSGWETYHQRCSYRYYLERHAGPTRHGIVPAYGEVPLATGTLLHQPMERLHRAWLKDGITTLPRLDSIVREALAEATDDYAALVATRSLDKTSGMSAEEAFALGLPQPDQRVSDAERAAEQSALIEGFAWTYQIHVLPTLMARGRVIWAERECVYLIPGTCTCGKEGLHDWGAHGVWTARPGTEPTFFPACLGVFLSATPDLILQRFSDGGYEYHELKSQASEGRAEQWQFKPQFLAGALTAEPDLLAKIDTYYVHVFIKGDLKKTYSPETGSYDGPKRQQSPFCYIYHRPPVPGVIEEDWALKYEWTNEQGQTKRLGKAYRKEPLWQMTFPGQPAGMSPVEYWVRWLEPAQLSACYQLVGPLGRQDWMERGWVAGVREWALDVQAAIDPLPSAYLEDPSSLEIARTFRQSWNCFPFKEQSCPMLPICTKQTGWETPWDDATRFVYRLPHHRAERERAVAEGWLSAESAAQPTYEEE